MGGTKRSRKSIADDVDGSRREENAEQDPEYEVDAILDTKVENVCLVPIPLETRRKLTSPYSRIRSNIL
jgi:hypothetical protein